MSTARVWLFGDDVDTDALAPGAYMSGGLATLASHCLETLDPAFASGVRPGDLVAAGVNFGVGSSREQAAQALKHLGVAAVLAPSFAGIFFRNAINAGLPLLEGDSSALVAGDVVSIDFERAVVSVPSRDVRIECRALPAFLQDILAAGGLVAHLKHKLSG